MKNFEQQILQVKIDNDIRNAQAENKELDNWIFKNYDLMEETDLKEAIFETLF